MPNTQPYRRIYRELSGAQFAHSGDYRYILDPRYASDRIGLVHAFKLIEGDLMRVFDFIEPADKNLDTYSHELYQLLLRSCTEVEANAKAILKANGYPSGRLDMRDYCKIDKACRLSEYVVTLPMWRGNQGKRIPYADWKSSHSLPWYQAYNDVKHDRDANFQRASFDNALDALAGLLVILFAQFRIHAFDAYRNVTMFESDENLFAYSHCPFTVRIPDSWAKDDLYNFNWKSISGLSDPFQSFSF